MPQATVESLTRQALAFRDARDWKQFHNAKDVAISLNLEAGELMELFQWKDSTTGSSNKQRLGEELSDILYWVLLMAHDQGIDLPKAYERKLAENERKYPVGKAKGKASKYTELHG